MNPDDKKAKGAGSAHLLHKEARVLAMRFNAEVARFSSWLFGSVMVAMTFLLLAGLRSPKMLLLVFMWTALGAFALSLLSYLMVSASTLKLVALSTDEGKVSGDASALARRVKLFQTLQQVLFVIGLVAVVGFTVEVAMLFFPGTTAQPAAGSSTGTGQ